jgi:Tfp pilus assembly pilus retraction ATPase PilT
MKSHATAVLDLVLERAQRDRASEIRFISGMCPAIVVEGGPQFVEVAQLKHETVRNIHQECLLLAGRSELASRATTSYTFASSKFGQYLCEFQIRGNVALLTLRPESDAGVTVDAARPKKSPSLRAEARPDESGPENDGAN